MILGRRGLQDTSAGRAAGASDGVTQRNSTQGPNQHAPFDRGHRLGPLSLGTRAGAQKGRHFSLTGFRSKLSEKGRALL